MATLNVTAVPSSTSVTVQNANNLTANIQGGNELTVQVVPTATQTIQINRGVQGPQGPAGPPGPNTIGGYPINITSAQQYDVLMFGVNQWVNTPQTEIADGGNF